MTSVQAQKGFRKLMQTHKRAGFSVTVLLVYFVFAAWTFFYVSAL